MKDDVVVFFLTAFLIPTRVYCCLHTRGIRTPLPVLVIEQIGGEGERDGEEGEAPADHV
jgi:hypothetical protein